LVMIDVYNSVNRRDCVLRYKVPINNVQMWGHRQQATTISWHAGATKRRLYRAVLH
jgi:hypothetical protein